MNPPERRPLPRFVIKCAAFAGVKSPRLLTFSCSSGHRSTSEKAFVNLRFVKAQVLAGCDTDYARRLGRRFISYAAA